jgi:hypothetical protein
MKKEVSCPNATFFSLYRLEPPFASVHGPTDLGISHLPYDFTYDISKLGTASARPPIIPMFLPLGILASNLE